MPRQGEQVWDLGKAIGSKNTPYEVTVTNRDVILYALGIGFQKDPMYEPHYDLTYENAGDFQMFPTMAVVIAHRGDIGELRPPGVPEFNPMMLLHGEENLQIISPIEIDSTIICQETIIDLQDKAGKATVMVIETTLTDKESGELKAKINMTVFIRGIGGFGRKGTYKNLIPEAPKTPADFVREETTTPNQAFIYRLSGDRNPLHVDPQMSEMGGFKVPILHGLCTYGITARAVFESYHPKDPQALESISGRFTSHVFPGETLVVSMWKEGNVVTFSSKTKERGKIVLKGSAILKTDSKM